MSDTPPTDPAEDCSRRCAQKIDIAARQTLMDLGIDPNRLYALDPEDLQPKTF